MAYSADVIASVRNSYVREALSIEDCAEKHGVPKPTVSVWKNKAKQNGDDWGKARAAARLAAGGLGEITTILLEDFALLFKQVVNELEVGEHNPLAKAAALSQLSDSYSKTMKAASVGNPKIAKLSIALDVIKIMSDVIKTEFPELLNDFLPVLDQVEILINRKF